MPAGQASLRRFGVRQVPGKQAASGEIVAAESRRVIARERAAH